MIRSQAWSSRGKVVAERGVVAGGDQREADAGIRIMQEGGNAIDALVAAAFVGFVVEPDSCGIGGYGRLSIYLEQQDEFITVDHYVRAPRAATETMYQVVDDGNRMYYGWPRVVDRANEWGYRSIAVPSAVTGLCKAHAMCGRLPLALVLQPAIEIAEEGLEVTWDLALAIANRMDDIRQIPESAVWLLPDGAMPKYRSGFVAGARLDTSALAGTLRRIAELGAAGFCEGPVADAIIGQVQANGGLLTHDDLIDYQPKVMRERPLRFRDHAYITAYDQVGYECLNILDRWDLEQLGAESLEFRHLMAEALGVSFADNMYWYGDPDYVDSPVSGLSNPSFGASRAKSIEFKAALSRPIEYDDPRPFVDGRFEPAFVPAGPSVGGVRGTSQMAAMDEQGNIATLCTSLSNSLGSLVYVPEAGVFLNDSMQNFDPRPGRANSIAPGKMPIFAAPVIAAAHNGRGRFGAAGSGGYRIASGVLHTMVGHLAMGMDLQTAIDHPRVHCQGEEMFVDSRIPQVVVEGLRELGHRVVVVEETPGTLNFARVVAVGRSPETGHLEVATGPSWSTGSAGW